MGGLQPGVGRGLGSLLKGNFGYSWVSWRGYEGGGTRK